MRAGRVRIVGLRMGPRFCLGVRLIDGMGWDWVGVVEGRGEREGG